MHYTHFYPVDPSCHSWVNFYSREWETTTNTLFAHSFAQIVNEKLNSSVFTIFNKIKKYLH